MCVSFLIVVIDYNRDEQKHWQSEPVIYQGYTAKLLQSNMQQLNKIISVYLLPVFDICSHNQKFIFGILMLMWQISLQKSHKEKLFFPVHVS